jgi:class 3 adenylate cyclase
MAKGALQVICYAIESGRAVDLAQEPRLYIAIAELMQSTDPLVRRWLYKLIGLLKLAQLAPWIQGQLAGVDADSENISWAAGALHALRGKFQAQIELTKLGIDYQDPVIRLAAGYFGSGRPIERSVLNAAANSDDALTHRWLSLRYGQDPSSVPKGLLADLVTSSSSSVIEYTVWAVHNDPRGRLSDVRLFPQDFAAFPTNVRRWYIRVVLKDAANILPYRDLLRAAMRDESAHVREGLALGLMPIPIDALLADEILEWFGREADPRVRFAIGRVLHAKRRKYASFHIALLAENDDSLVAQAFIVQKAPRTSRIFIPGQGKKSKRGQSVRSTLPTIVSDSEESVHLLGVDTVDFSTKTDKQQYTIFRDLLDSLQHEDILVNVNPDEVAVLLTGDGMFIGFRHISRRLAPLQLALQLRRTFAALRSYELRFGINSGPATWIFMNEGGPQVISHAVNWTARVMAGAHGSQILMSDTYYQTYVLPARDLLPGVKLMKVGDLLTKHGEPLVAWEAVEAAV